MFAGTILEHRLSSRPAMGWLRNFISCRHAFINSSALLLPPMALQIKHVDWKHFIGWVSPLFFSKQQTRTNDAILIGRFSSSASFECHQLYRWFKKKKYLLCESGRSQRSEWKNDNKIYVSGLIYSYKSLYLNILFLSNICTNKDFKHLVRFGRVKKNIVNMYYIILSELWHLTPKNSEYTPLNKNTTIDLLQWLWNARMLLIYCLIMYSSMSFNFIGVHCGIPIEIR